MIKRVLPFVLTLLVGVALGSFWNRVSLRSNEAPRVSPARSWTYGGGGSSRYRSRSSHFDFAPHNIIYEPNTRLTSAARKNKTTGIVRLRVMFGADGKASVVERVWTLPDGLTEEAERAAERIRFTPATEYGQPVPVIKEHDFIFSLDRY